ncbi:sugar phosphate isomerase/epimerase family protein [Lewinella sp. LCG006]|uniref:sugar phosphate isomerase/epimerase family protein n=1 Tax=Lewinella sp. LCG006 TaxID=3231911 RepID=UPI003461271A
MSTRIFLPFLLLFIFSCSSKPQEPTDMPTEEATEPAFKISLAQWSLHRSFFGGAIDDWEAFGRMLDESPDSLLQGELDPMDFPTIAAGYGVNSIELVNTFYFSKAQDEAYLTAFRNKCQEAGVSVGLIMCDRLGDLGDADEAARQKAVENHYPWVDAAQFLGAHSIRVNAAGSGTAEEVAAQAAAGLAALGTYAATKNINVIVENHGGYSSNGAWLAGVMKQVNMDNVGTLPDFGNFCIERGPAYECLNEYDRYQGVAELMPYAKGVSAKTHEFNAEGEETHTDFLRMMKIVKEAGYNGYVGIEYEGRTLSEDEGIKATKALLEKVLQEL